MVIAVQHLTKEVNFPKKESSVNSPLPPECSPLALIAYQVKLGSEKSVAASHFKTFKIVGDNIDKYIRETPRHERGQPKSLHSFNVYASPSRLP